MRNLRRRAAKEKGSKHSHWGIVKECVQIAASIKTTREEDLQVARMQKYLNLAKEQASAEVHVGQEESEQQVLAHLGDLRFYTVDAMQSRAKLRSHPRILQMVRELWECEDLQKVHQDSIAESEYSRLSVKLSQALTGCMDRDENLATAAEDWQTDSGGKGYMTHREFHNAIFELVDVWCLTTDLEEYVGCLARLLYAVTDGRYRSRKFREDKDIHEIHPDGHLPEILPAPEDGEFEPPHFEIPADTLEIREELGGDHDGDVHNIQDGASGGDQDAARKGSPDEGNGAEGESAEDASAQCAPVGAAVKDPAGDGSDSCSDTDSMLSDWVRLGAL